MTPLLLLSTALAGAVYINGVRADVLPETTLADVSVRFDSAGNVWIDAPKYRVAAIPAEPAPSPRPNPVAAGQWWLVTDDRQSTGQAMNVLVNGVPVYRIQSGQGQVIVDLGRYLLHGANEVRIEPVGTDVIGSGVLNVYVGHGVNEAGTVRIDETIVRYARSAADPQGAHSYVLTVP